MRVVAIVGYPGVPWENDWVKASGYAAEVVRLSNSDALTWPRVGGAPYLAQDPDDPWHYQIKTFSWRPSRLLGRLSHALMARRYRQAVRYVARTHGAVDVVHAHFYWAHYLVAMRRELGIPYVVTEHHTSWQGHWTEPPPSPLGIKRARELYAGAATVITVCKSLLDKIGAYGLTGNFEVVHNPVDASGFALPAPDARREQARDTVEFVSVARLAPAKGFDVLIDAFAAAAREDPRLRLTIVGDGRDRPKLEEQATRLRVADVITFAGRQPRTEIARLLSESDAFVLASRAENLTVAVLEAWCAGLPVITTDVGGHAEVMEPHLGHLVPAEDTAALAAALRAVADAPEAYDRHRIAVEARKKFAPEAVGAELARIYRSAIAGDRAGSV